MKIVGLQLSGRMLHAQHVQSPGFNLQYEKKFLNLNIRSKTTRRKEGETHQDVSIGNDFFLYKTPKAQAQKAKIDKWDDIT